jgi:hypothetical protein
MHPTNRGKKKKNNFLSGHKHPFGATADILKLKRRTN